MRSALCSLGGRSASVTFEAGNALIPATVFNRVREGWASPEGLIMSVSKRVAVPACTLQNTLEQSHFLELNERRASVKVRPQRDSNTDAFLGVLEWLRGFRLHRNPWPWPSRSGAAASRARARPRAAVLSVQSRFCTPSSRGRAKVGCYRLFDRWK
ncbi:hypothetical protein PO909_016363 [Leuciscus waleckii]